MQISDILGSEFGVYPIPRCSFVYFELFHPRDVIINSLFKGLHQEWAQATVLFLLTSGECSYIFIEG